MREAEWKEGRDGQGIEIRFAEMFSPVTITNMENVWQKREMLEKMQRNTCERLPCPGLSSLQVEKIPHEAVWRRGELDTESFSSHCCTILQGCLHFVRAILVISQICDHLPNRRTLHMGPFATWNWSGSKQCRPAGPWERFNLPYCTCLLQTNPLSSSP